MTAILLAEPAHFQRGFHKLGSSSLFSTQFQGFKPFGDVDFIKCEPPGTEFIFTFFNGESDDPNVAITALMWFSLTAFWVTGAVFVGWAIKVKASRRRRDTEDTKR